MATARNIATSLLSNDVLKGSAGALAIKFGGSILGFTMFALAARAMDPHAFGTLAVIFNAMAFLAVLAGLGQETLIVRSWDEYCGTGRPALARGALFFGIKVTVGAALVTTTLVAIVWPIMQPQISTSLVLAACAFLLAQALMNFSAQFARVAGGVFVGEPAREIVWRFLMVVTIIIHQLLQEDFSPAEFFVTATAALLLSVLLQQLQVARVLPKAVTASKPQSDLTEWIPRSFRMWVSALLETSSQYLEVIVIGFFLGPTAAAFYFVATRITNVFAMISGGITSYATSQISNLFHSDAKDELQTILRSLAFISAALAGGAFLVILLGGKLLLWIFGAVYVSAYPALLVLAAGAAVGTLTGPAAYLLLLTGNEGTYARITACGLLSRLVLIAVLGPWLGLLGGAIAWSLSAIGMALALVIACRQRIRLDPSILGTLLRPQTAEVKLKESHP